MPDMTAQATLNNLSNDASKLRFNTDLTASDSGASQFLNAMMSSLTSQNNSSDDLKDTSQSSSASSDTNVNTDNTSSASATNSAPATTAPSKNDDSNNVTDTAQASTTSKTTSKSGTNDAAQAKADAKEKIKAKIKDILSQDQTPLQDTRAVDALKKVANFLLNAQNSGQIQLPDAITSQLKDFLNQADSLSAGGVADFMQNFTNVFRQLNLSMTASTSPSASATPADGSSAPNVLAWPKEITDAFKALNISGFALNNGQQITPLDAVRALKALVNASENAASATLQSKAQAAVATTQQNPSIAAIPMAPVLGKKAAAAQDPITDAVATITAGNVKKATAATPNPVPASIAKTLADAVTMPLNNKADSKNDILPQPKFSNDGLPVARQDSSPLPPANTAQQQILQQQPEVNAAILVNNSPPVSSTVKVDADVVTGVDGVVSSTALPNPSGLLVNQPATALSAINQARFANMVNGTTQSLNQASASPLDQVIVQLQARAGKSSQITVQLTPAELGRVDIRLDVKRDGQTHTVVSADRPETLALLQKDASQLQKALQQAGLNANSENMSFNLREQRGGQQGFSKTKRLANDAIEAAPQDLALNVHGDGDIISDTRVNYHA